MNWVWALLGAAAVLAALVLALSAVCFLIVFYAPRKKGSAATQEPDLPRGKAYEPYRELMLRWAYEMRALPREDISITSHDGLTLYGSYYEKIPGAPVELMFHGYRGTAERDLCGGVQRCFACGRNALVVDQRAASRSDGRVISFGVNEHRDCIAWAEFAAERFGPQTPLILTGISMGAATVMMAAGEPLPKSVVGVLADCGYTSAREIICKCADQMHLPSRLAYPLVRLGARLFGGFDPDDANPVESLKRCCIPVIFFHGEADDFVPCEMSRVNYAACAAPKRLVTVPNAGHGASFLIDQEGYLAELDAFAKEHHWSQRAT